MDLVGKLDQGSLQQGGSFRVVALPQGLAAQLNPDLGIGGSGIYRLALPGHRLFAVVEQKLMSRAGQALQEPTAGKLACGHPGAGDAEYPG